jgi:hypothetical protein
MSNSTANTTTMASTTFVYTTTLQCSTWARCATAIGTLVYGAVTGPVYTLQILTLLRHRKTDFSNTFWILYICGYFWDMVCAIKKMLFILIGALHLGGVPVDHYVHIIWTICGADNRLFAR